MKAIYYLSIFIIYNFFDSIDAHGRLMDPPARSSAWREIPGFPIYYEDNQMFCGGFQVQWEQNGGKCGICGESYSTNPKLFERGGEYYVGKSVRTYKKGETIHVRVEISANHLGWFEFKICNVDGWETDATVECLDKTLLHDAKGNSRFQVSSAVGYFDYKLVLPAGLKCDQCVFQWKYNTGNSWGTDPETGQSCVGCGPQEQFYGCADVTITDGERREEL